MKKIIYLFLIIGMMQSCQKDIYKGDMLTINSVYFKNRSPQTEGKYLYKIKVGNDDIGHIFLGSDSLYSIGDTLKLVKQ